MPILDVADPIALLLASHDALAAAGLQAAVYGGLALAAFGAPRETRDADLASTGFGADAAVAAMKDAALASPSMAIRRELRDELLTLPAREREELADQLYESLEDEPHDPDWERAWSQEIERRLAEVKDGGVALLDADEVHAALRAELREPRR